MRIENPFVFYPWHWMKTLRGLSAYVSTTVRLRQIYKRIASDPRRFEYRDEALTLAGEGGFVEATRVTDYARRRIANHSAREVEA